MKKLRIIQLSTALSLLMITFTACSQDLTMNTAARSGSVSLASNEKPGEPVYRNEISSKVLRSFFRSYGEIPSAKWYRSANIFTVYFSSDGINKTVYYKTNGLVECKISYYNEDKLPPAIRHIVRSNFYDYSIFHVTEVLKNNTTAFFVKVQDEKTIKTIKVVDSEWELVEELTKR